jgi:hypothetical protein
VAVPPPRVSTLERTTGLKVGTVKVEPDESTMLMVDGVDDEETGGELSKAVDETETVWPDSVTYGKLHDGAGV